MRAAHSAAGARPATHMHRRAPAAPIACCQRTGATALRTPVCSQLPRAQGIAASLVCRYMSVKDRLGQPDDEGPHQEAKGDAGVQPPEETTQGPGTATTTAWRKKDAADRRAATSVLDAIQSGAVAANPDQAGHPEQHRVLRTGDYLAEQRAVADMSSADDSIKGGAEGQQAEGEAAK